MLSTRKQKAREKRSRQSHVMSDIENFDVVLGNIEGNDQVRDEKVGDADFDLGSRRQQVEENLVGENSRSHLNTNASENSETTAETSRAINSEISSQMSRKLGEMKSDLNLHKSDAINSAIEENLISSIKNATGGQSSAKNTNLDLRSDRVFLVTYVLRGTFGQIDHIQKRLRKGLRMLKKTSPDC